MKDKINNLWLNKYTIVIPILIVVCYFIALTKEIDGIHFTKSIYLQDMLTALITFSSIILSLLGVLLTIFISEKDKSRIIQYFFENSSKNEFVKQLKTIVVSGLMVIVISAVLFLNDMYSDKIAIFLEAAEIFTFSWFVLLTYRFIGILLKLIVSDDKGTEKKVCNEPTEEERQEVMEGLPK